MSPLTSPIARVMLRELESVRREIEMYPDEGLLWLLPPGLPNSGGTLALHVAGNLRHYLGAVLGGDGYSRDRKAEFATRDLSRAEVSARVAAAEKAVTVGLAHLADRQLDEPFAEPLRGAILPTRDVLLQLAVHLAYHLGQISYHRRLVTGDARGVDAVNPDLLMRGADA